MSDLARKVLTVPGILLIMFAAVMIPGCDNQSSSDNDTTSFEQVERETRDLLQTIKSYSADKKDAALAKADKALDRLDGRIDELQAKIDNRWESMTATARQQARANMQSLRQQREELAQWYDKMKTSSADAWEHVKQGFSDAFEALDQARVEAENEFASKD